MNFRSTHISNRPLTSLLLVGLLTLSTLWLSSATAAHIHLDNNDIQCELCLNPNNRKASLETNPTDFVFTSTRIHVVVACFSAPQRPLVAPYNSRAPPSL
tara:strand:- start:19413 stop:19712 length:300 start_codon:yes stop_codon:yes gene_type:complete